MDDWRVGAEVSPTRVASTLEHKVCKVAGKLTGHCYGARIPRMHEIHVGLLLYRKTVKGVSRTRIDKLITIANTFPNYIYTYTIRCLDATFSSTSLKTYRSCDGHVASLVQAPEHSFARAVAGMCQLDLYHSSSSPYTVCLEFKTSTTRLEQYRVISSGTGNLSSGSNRHP